MDDRSSKPRVEAHRASPGLPTAPLWGAPGAWREATETVAWLVRRFAEPLTSAKIQAQAIHRELASVFPNLDWLCRHTCRWCPEPCCQVATVWIDFQDLVFFHLIGRTPPGAPLISEVGDVCRYSGPRGCTLARICRPWICTWYVCPTQQAILRGREQEMGREIDRAFTAIKKRRSAMAAAFIDAVR